MYQYNAMSAEMESREEQQIVLLTNRISLNERFLSQKLRENNVIWKKKKIDSHQLSKKLQAHTLYMDFVKSAETYYLFTLNSQQHIDLNRFSRKETVEIDKEIVALHEKIEKISKKEQFADIQQAYTQYGKLYDLLIANIDISKYDDLIISPDGRIDLLPFEALYDRKKKKFLLQKKNIRYVSSANELFLEIDTKRKDIVIFADPNFDASVNHNGGKSGKIDPEVVRSDFSKLPGTKKEAFAIKNIFPESKLYIEENATEENLLNVDSPAILHIATHGFFLDKQVSYSALEKSGIVLNGVNTTTKEEHTEGIITGLELAGLSLAQNNLVVLSSCYSGLGVVEDGEGMIGLGDAFKKAGAKNILTSLWAVQDELGGNMMQLFYENIKNKKNYDVALRDAKIEILNEGYIHPYYWGGFLLHGKGQ